MFDVRDHLDELLDPACYPARPATVRFVETHISCVFLAGDTVYKLKKPVDFGFVDYSTLARRREFCALEIALNRRLSHDTYLGVSPLVQTPAGLRFDVPGRPVEYAVRMRRVPDAALWSRRLAGGSLGAPQMEALAAFVAEFHAGATRLRSRRHLAARDAAWDETVRDLRRFAGTLFASTLLERIEADGAARRQALTPVLQRRLRAGRFVDGHGDLRLEHLCEQDGRLQALDCIEFNPALRHLDAASDLAFLLMDLDRNERHDLAQVLAATYLRASGDASLPLCDRLYRAERALVRAKVDALAQQAGGRAGTSPAALRERAGKWAALAAAYLAPVPAPALIVVHGISGTGKTTLATRLAVELGAAWLGTDYLRKQRLALGPRDRAGPGTYDPAARRAIYTALHRAAGWYLARGFPVVLDATYLEPAIQVAAARLARRQGVPGIALQLKLGEPELRRRFEARTPSASDAGWEVAAAQIRDHPGRPFAGMREVQIDAGRAHDAILARALEVCRGLGG